MTAENKPPALVVRGLTVGYGDGANVLAGLNWTLPSGCFCSLLGDNGVGKSSLLKAIAGLIPFRRGHISVSGHDCRSSHAMVSYLPQHEGVNLDFPVVVRDVVMMGKVRELGWLRFARRRDWQVVERALAQVGMLDHRERSLAELSVGQRRRVFLALALAQKVDLLLLDEPFAGVDNVTRCELCNTLIELNTAGLTIIVATHSQDARALPYDCCLELPTKPAVGNGIGFRLSGAKH